MRYREPRRNFDKLLRLRRSEPDEYEAAGTERGKSAHFLFWCNEPSEPPPVARDFSLGQLRVIGANSFLFDGDRPECQVRYLWSEFPADGNTRNENWFPSDPPPPDLRVATTPERPVIWRAALPGREDEGAEGGMVYEYERPDGTPWEIAEILIRADYRATSGQEKIRNGWEIASIMAQAWIRRADADWLRGVEPIDWLAKNWTAFDFDTGQKYDIQAAIESEARGRAVQLSLEARA